jgi:hypothetical protein
MSTQKAMRMWVSLCGVMVTFIAPNLYLEGKISFMFLVLVLTCSLAAWRNK